MSKNFSSFFYDSLKCVGIIYLLCCLMLLAGQQSVFAQKEEITLNSPSCILVDYTTGKVLYEKNPDEPRPMASVTKIMTMLLTMEEIDSGNLSYDDVVVGSAHAKSYGGSTIFLDEGEQMSVRDILKGIAVASGNDAAVAIAEHISGSESAFVEKMNKRASELGMTNTHFVNCNGLDADEHYSSARDISIMSRELMKHSGIFEFTTIWMDSLRDGSFTLSNTNKLIKFYDGATGLKTGSTSKAGFCVSATAQRNNMHLIAVIMGAETSKIRNAEASTLLNYGFGNFEIVSLISKEDKISVLNVSKGDVSQIEVYPEEDFYYLKSKDFKIDTQIDVSLPTEITAPILPKCIVGSADVVINGEKVKSVNLISKVNVKKLKYTDFIVSMMNKWVCG